jgi:hypothetical protein
LAVKGDVLKGESFRDFKFCDDLIVIVIVASGEE